MFRRCLTFNHFGSRWRACNSAFDGFFGSLIVEFLNFSVVFRHPVNEITDHGHGGDHHAIEEDVDLQRTLRGQADNLLVGAHGPPHVAGAPVPGGGGRALHRAGL